MTNVVDYVRGKGPATAAEIVRALQIEGQSVEAVKSEIRRRVKSGELKSDALVREGKKNVNLYHTYSEQLSNDRAKNAFLPRWKIDEELKREVSSAVEGLEKTGAYNNAGPNKLKLDMLAAIVGKPGSILEGAFFSIMKERGWVYEPISQGFYKPWPKQNAADSRRYANGDEG